MMVDTPRNLTDLLGIAPINTNYEISPQDLRDFMVSVMPGGRFSTKVIAASDDSALNKVQADHRADGVDDEEEVKTAFTEMGSTPGFVLLGAGNHVWNSANTLPTISNSRQYLIGLPGARVTISGGSSASYFLECDGSSALIERVGSFGFGAEIHLTEADDCAFHVHGQAQYVFLNGWSIVHDDPDASSEAMVLIDGNIGGGIEQVRVNLAVYGGGFGSGNQEHGGVLLRGNVRHVSGAIHFKHCSYGISTRFNDMLPDKVIHHDDSAGSDIVLTNAFDGNTATSVAVTLDAGDYLAFGFARPVQSLTAILDAGQTVEAYLQVEVLKTGPTWTRIPLSKNNTIGTTSKTTFEQTGEIVWTDPLPSDWETLSLDGTTAYWIRLTPYDTGSGAAPTAIDEITIAAVIGFEIPRDIQLTGSAFDMSRTAIQSRGSHRLKTEFQISGTSNHGVNHNSDDTESLDSGQNDRLCKTRWAEDESTVDGTRDTCFVTRCAEDGRVTGIYTATFESHCLEQADAGPGSIYKNAHKTTGYVYDCTLNAPGRTASIVRGDNNRFKISASDAAFDHTLTNNSDDRSGIRMRKTNFATAPTGNYFEGCNIHGFANRMRHGILVNSDVDLPNYVGENLILGATVSPIEDEGGALVVMNPQNNFAATANPTTDDDKSTGYWYGSRWLNISTGAYFVCVDPTIGSANWDQVTLT